MFSFLKGLAERVRQRVRSGWFRAQMAKSRAEHQAFQKYIESSIIWRHGDIAVAYGLAIGFAYVVELRHGKYWYPISRHALVVTATDHALDLINQKRAKEYERATEILPGR